jgi:hypothetical protein
MLTKDQARKLLKQVNLPKGWKIIIKELTYLDAIAYTCYDNKTICIFPSSLYYMTPSVFLNTIWHEIGHAITELSPKRRNSHTKVWYRNAVKSGYNLQMEYEGWKKYPGYGNWTFRRWCKLMSGKMYQFYIPKKFR